MNASLRNIALVSMVPLSLGTVLAAGLMWPRTVNSEPAAKEAAKGPVQRWAKVRVDLPASQVTFPPGNGSVIANAYCLICHSAGMVLRQPPLPQDEWTTEINKMRNAFGAPLPADQVEALAKYLRSINGQSPNGPPAVDGRAG
jgi:mono/diheme cytochrome c family protein